MSENLFNPKLLKRIRQLLLEGRSQLQQKINHQMVQTYWQVGQMIVEDEQQGKVRAVYGRHQLEALSVELTLEFGRGFNVRNLRNMRAFYQAYPIWNAVRTELSWTHHRILMRIENVQAREWYTQETIEQNWSTRALERQIGVFYYERLLASQDKQPVQQEALEKTQPLLETPQDYLRDPYILDFLNLPSTKVLESELEQGLIDNLQHFLLELGRGFAFVARQQRVSGEDQDFYIDLVFYHFKLKCFVLIDLKMGKLTHQDVGQMDSYIRIYDQHKRGKDDNPTIGLILCSEKSETVVKYSVLTDSQQMFAAKYLPYLPTEEELKRELERERQLVERQIEETKAIYAASHMANKHSHAGSTNP